MSEATAAAARPDGSYELAGVRLDVRQGAVRNSRGALAGSALTLDGGVRSVVALGVPVAEALAAVTAAPARLLRP